jgi:ferredoxin
MKVTIDRNECTSCGTCWETCPAFFEENPEDHFSKVIDKFRSGRNIAEGTAPQDLEACVREAADLCPVLIITVGKSE